MYKFNDNLDKNEYDKFVNTYSMASFMQDYNWSLVKDSWKCIHCGLYKDNNLVAVCTILVKNIIKNIKLFYVPRGYLIDYTNYEDLKEFTKNIKILAKKNHAYVVKIDPNYCKREFSFKDKEIPINYSINADLKDNNLKKCGYKFNGIIKDMSKSFQPQYNVFAPIIDINSKLLTNEEILSTYNKKFKYYLNGFHEKRGIHFTHTDDINKLDDFISLLKETEKKQNISLRNKEYFEKIMNEYKGYAYLFFATINLNEYLNFLKEKEKLDEIDEVESFIRNGTTEIILSTALVLLPKNDKVRTSEYLYAGNSKLFTKLSVSAGLVFDIIKFSRDNNCSYCNLGGVEGTLDDNLTNFKQSFNGIVMEFTGEYDLPISILYYPIKLFYPFLLKTYKKICRKKK